MSHGDDLKANLTWRLNELRTLIIHDNGKNQALAVIHSQTLQVKNTLKYYEEFCRQTLTITSLLHQREHSLYVFEQVNKVSIGTQSGCRSYRRSNYILQRAEFNPHLPRTIILWNYYRYRIQGSLVHHSSIVIVRKILRRATVDGRGWEASSYEGN